MYATASYLRMQFFVFSSKPGWGSLALTMLMGMLSATGSQNSEMFFEGDDESSFSTRFVIVTSISICLTVSIGNFTQEKDFKSSLYYDSYQ